MAVVAGVVAQIMAQDSSVGAGLVCGAALWGVLAVVSLLAVAEGLRLMMDVKATVRQIRDRLPTHGDKG